MFSIATKLVTGRCGSSSRTYFLDVVGGVVVVVVWCWCGGDVRVVLVVLLAVMVALAAAAQAVTVHKFVDLTTLTARKYLALLMFGHYQHQSNNLVTTKLLTPRYQA